MPSCDPLFKARRGEHSYDTASNCPDSIAIIALPADHEKNLVNTTDYTAHAVLEVHDYRIFDDAVRNVSFDVPADADLRFRALLRDFHLDTVEINDGEVRVAGVSSSPLASRSERMYARVRPEQLCPRWKLFSTAFADW